MSLHISMATPDSDMLTISNYAREVGIVDETVTIDGQPQRLSANVFFAPSGATSESTWAATGQHFPLDVEIRPTLESCIVERRFVPIVVPKAYVPIGVLAGSFLVAGLLLSSFMVALSGVGLLATIGTALWEIKTKREIG